MDTLKLQHAFARYLTLPLDDNKVIATYIFVDLKNNLCAKAKTLDSEPRGPDEVPPRSYAACQALEEKDVTLTPVAIFKDPFLRGSHKLVVCDVARDGEPCGPNGRTKCKETIEQCADKEMEFGMVQEYTILDADGHPFRWPKYGQPTKPADSMVYMCGVGNDRTYGRALSDAHYLACLYAGIRISGTKAQCTPSQWEYQIGPGDGVATGDHMLAARYVLMRCSEDFGVTVSLEPRPIQGPWNGAACRLNVSTAQTREGDGIKHITEAIEKLAKKAVEHLAVYDPSGGLENLRRLEGALNCDAISEFTSGVSRNASVRIPQHVNDLGFGYFEDRRPAANCNPYMVIERMANTLGFEDPESPESLSS